MSIPSIFKPFVPYPFEITLEKEQDQSSRLNVLLEAIQKGAALGDQKLVDRAIFLLDQNETQEIMKASFLGAALVKAAGLGHLALTSHLMNKLPLPSREPMKEHYLEALQVADLRGHDKIARMLFNQVNPYL